MQTFLPYSTFRQSARVLDRLRLGKQRCEAWQILQVLLGKTKGWANHPAVRTWRGYEPVLCIYGMEMCGEWISRGYRDTLHERFCRTLRSLEERSLDFPPWRGDPSFHASHRSVLLAKDPEWYGQLGWTEAPAERVDGSWPYVWPVDKDGRLRLSSERPTGFPPRTTSPSARSAPVRSSHTARSSQASDGEVCPLSGDDVTRRSE